jgi:hypothetical protein
MGEGVPGYADYTANVPFRLLPGVSWRPAALHNNSMEPSPLCSGDLRPTRSARSLLWRDTSLGCRAAHLEAVRRTIRR